MVDMQVQRIGFVLYFLLRLYGRAAPLINPVVYGRCKSMASRQVQRIWFVLMILLFVREICGRLCRWRWIAYAGREIMKTSSYLLKGSGGPSDVGLQVFLQGG